MRRAVFAALAACAVPGLVVAQGRPAAAFGPAIAGVCAFDRGMALDRSAAGESADQQIGQFIQGIHAELGAERAAIQADDRALAQRKASMPAADYDRQLGQIRQRYAGLDAEAATRNEQLHRTTEAAATLVGQALDPSLAEVVAERRCAVVLAKPALDAVNPAMDITGAVIQRMNARLPGVSLRLAPSAPR